MWLVGMITLLEAPPQKKHVAIRDRISNLLSIFCAEEKCQSREVNIADETVGNFVYTF